MKVKIIGAGASGRAAEWLLSQRQIETVVVKEATETVAGEFDFCVVSPGVPAADYATEEIPVIPEVELPFYLDKKLRPRCLVAVTGTNGKTTVVKQIHQACQNAGLRSVLCGNVGVPVSRVASQLPGAVAVVEVSSFMLEQTKVLHPHIAVLTNITGDHLDRHGTMSEYIRCKQRITAQQTKRDWLVVNWDDANARAVGQAISAAGKPKVCWYSATEPVAGIYVRRGQIYERCWWGRRKLGFVRDLGGMTHTVENALAVLAVGRKLKIKPAQIFDACRFREQKHRIELVADDRGLAFYNDSKATNIAATLAAVRAFNLPVCLLLCGLTKGQDYADLFAELPANVVQIFVFGACQSAVLTAAATACFTAIRPVADLNAAVRAATQVCPRPGVVLFSPGGSSFDQFRDYQDRGNKFTEIVQQIIQPGC